MERKQKLLIRWMIIFLVIIIGIIVLLIFLNNGEISHHENVTNSGIPMVVQPDTSHESTQNSTVEEINDQIESTPKEPINHTIQLVLDRTDYFTVSTLYERLFKDDW